MSRSLNIVIIYSLLIGCQHKPTNNFEVAIINDSTKVELILGETNELVCLVTDSISSKWPLPYPVYQYQYGDIDNNGSVDLAVGVFKPTRYDTVKRNRLFLYEVRNNAIIPLWLGTSVGHPIINFKMIQNSEGKNLIRIIGREKTETFLIADYEWYGFGLSLSDYIKRDISLEFARELFYTGHRFKSTSFK
ncbi:MAG: nuclear receptor-binding factor 2 [Bacteroidota bacterium]